MPEHPSAELNDGCLNEESYWRMRERKVAIWNIAERDAIRILKNVAQIPQHRDVAVLPDYDQPCRRKQGRGNYPLDCRKWELGRIVRRRRLRFVRDGFHNSSRGPWSVDKCFSGLPNASGDN
jgi:hypothetical protein